MQFYSNEKILIIGLGKTGRSCLKFLLSKGIKPRLMDSRKKPSEIKNIPLGLECHLGSINKSWILQSTLVIISPGVNLDSNIIYLMKCNNIKLIGDIELFAYELLNPIIAITGSNGKTTVTNILYKISQLSGLNVGVGGNIGIPVLELVYKKYQLYILELSSFQLETINTLHVIIASILNISYDHMDRYPLGMTQYQNIKLKIYNHAKIGIMFNDDIRTFPNKINNLEKCITFGSVRGDYYLKKYNNLSYWLMAYNVPIISTDDIKVKGLHNYINALSALAIADSIGIPRYYSIQALRTFTGLPHRCEYIETNNNNIIWINDSKSTNIGSTQAILSYLKYQGVLHLLLGGDSKSADFTELFKYLYNRKVILYCFGKDGENIAFMLKDINKKIFITDTLEQSMNLIYLNVKSFDVILLSPACSSLDQYSSFEERGNVFKNLVYNFISR